MVLGENGKIMEDEFILKRYEEYYCKLLGRKPADNEEENKQEKIVVEKFNSKRLARNTTLNFCFWILKRGDCSLQVTQ